MKSDVPDNQYLISLYLENAGAKVSIAEDGEKAVEMAPEGNFDVVLMDIQLPLLDGYEATLALRKKGYLRPIIALTSHVFVDEKEKCREFGFDEFITKPINRLRLIQEISHWAGNDHRIH